MINSLRLEMKKTYLFLIVAFFTALAGCSYGVDSYIRIIPSNDMKPVDAFRKLDEIVSARPELILESKCEENHTRYMYKYRLAHDNAIDVAVILNTENGVLALGYGQLGVKEFTPEAKDFFGKLSSSLEKQFGVDRVIAIAKGEKGDFVKLLKGDEKRLYFCGQKESASQ